VVIDPYDKVAGMDAIVAHELSHHTFLACGAFADAEFTAAFYAAQGLPAGRDWFDYSAGWSGTPAEHFAEVMAVTVSGAGEGGIPISDEAVSLMARWLAGAPLTAPAPAHDPVPYAAVVEATGPATTDGGVTQPTPAPPAPQPEPEPERQATSIQLFSEVLEVFLPSTGAFWLNTWRVIGPL
jgi:hypothetical protein